MAGHTEAVNAIAYSPTGNVIASGSADRTIRLWNAATGTLERTLTGHQGGVKSLAFSPNGETLVSASGEFDDQGARVWNLKDGTVRQLVERDGYWVHYLAFAPNGKLVAAALAMRRGPVWVSVYEVGTGNLVRVVDPEKLTESIAFSPDSNALVTAGHNNVLIWWRLPQGTATFTLRGHKAYITGVAFVPGGRQIVSGSADGTVRLWRIATRTLERTFSVK